MIATAASGLLLLACGSKDAPDAPHARRKAPATVAAREVVVAPELVFPATLVAVRDASLSSTRGGRVEAQLFEIGERVRKGDIVARVGQGELVFASQMAAAGAMQAQARLGDASGPEGAPGVLTAKAALESAEDAVVRAEKLFAQGSMSEQELLRARNAAKSARADYSAALASARADVGRLAEMRAAAGQAGAALADKDLRAPFDGVVLQRVLDVGQMAAPHAPIVRVVDPSGLVVRFEIPQADAAKAIVGAKTRFLANGLVVAGEVLRGSPGLVGEASTRTVEASLAKIDAGTLPGMHGSIALASGPPEPLVEIPTSATTSLAGVTRAWVLDAAHLQPRLLSVVRVEGEKTLVRRGLRAGEAVVATPAPDFRADEEVVP